MNRSLLTLFALTSLAGCTGSGTTPPPSKAGAAAPSGGLKVAPQQASGVAERRTSPAPAAAPTIPAGAKYAISLARYAGPDHIEQARLAKERLIADTGRPDFHVRHEEQFTELFYGYYRERERSVDPGEVARLDADIAFIRSIKNALGGPMFTAAIATELPTADPQGPAEYDLARLDRGKDPKDPTRKFWTVVVAVYTADARDENQRPIDRKQAVVDVVTQMRKAGGIEAYYYHGKTVSQICIGAWPRTAVQEQEMAAAESRSEFKANSGEALVVSPVPLPQKFTDKVEARGNLQVVQPRIEILDPTLKKTLDSYPEYAVNGARQEIVTRDPVTGKSTTKIQPCFLAEIPRPTATILTGGASGNDAPPPTAINPLNPGSSTTGGLRGAGR